jgi:predicted SAM-dependent methyltransferase
VIDEVKLDMIELLKKFLKSNRHLYVPARHAHMFLLHLLSHRKWGLLSKRRLVYLDLGSGFKKGVGNWVTVDQSGADINWDLRRKIPLKDGSIDKIYSSHLLEHIPYEQLIVFLGECRRILREGGEFLVCVPNARYYIEAYMAGEMFSPKSNWYLPAMVDTESCIDQLNYIAYMGGEHKYLFDEENLLKTLLKSGFSSAASRKFDPDLDLKSRELESIYAVAHK